MTFIGLKWRDWLKVFKPTPFWWLFTIVVGLIEFLYPIPGRPGWLQLLIFLALWLGYWVCMYLLAFVIVMARRRASRHREPSL